MTPPGGIRERLDIQRPLDATASSPVPGRRGSLSHWDALYRATRRVDKRRTWSVWQTRRTTMESPSVEMDARLIARSPETGPKRSLLEVLEDGRVGQQGVGEHAFHRHACGDADMLRKVSRGSRRRTRMMIMIFMIIVFFGVGVGFYSGHEGWDVIDVLYFCIIVLTTVGYGDHPLIETDGARVFTGFFILYGVGIVAVAISIIINNIIGMHKEYAKRMKMKKMEMMCEDPLKMEGTQSPEDPKRSWLLQGALIAVGLCIVYGSGILVIMLQEEQDHNFAAAFYFVCISSTTVGFGDISFTTVGGKWFAIFWLIIATFVTVSLFSKLGSYIIGNDDLDEVLDDELNEEFFRELDASGDADGNVDLYEWISFVLDRAGYIEKDMLKRIKLRFEQLDVDGSGTLNTNDFCEPFREKQRRDTELRNSMVVDKSFIGVSLKRNKVGPAPVEESTA